jgi:hypothetical protein
MGQCSRCGRKRWLRKFAQRLAVPELRAMVSHWPWHHVEVCPDCEEAFGEEFRQRLRLLAPEVIAQEGDISEHVCLLCGDQTPGATYLHSGRWVDLTGRPVATRFSVCAQCQGKVIEGNVISVAELRSAAGMQKVLAALPEVNEDLVRRNEGWSLDEGPGPEGAANVARDLSLEEATRRTMAFWARPPREITEAPGEPIRGATLLPDSSGAIRTHLDLRWRTSHTNAPHAAAIAVYRTAAAYTVARFPV